MCRGAINWAKIKKVYYGCDSDDAGEIGFDEKDGNNDGMEMEQIDRDECWEFFKEYGGIRY